MVVEGALEGEMDGDLGPHAGTYRAVRDAGDTPRNGHRRKRCIMRRRRWKLVPWYVIQLLASIPAAKSQRRLTLWTLSRIALRDVLLPTGSIPCTCRKIYGAEVPDDYRDDRLCMDGDGGE